MSNLIFDVSKNWKRYDSSTDYGESIMKEFCSLIGATYINNRHGCCYGFGDAALGEYKLSLTVQRDRPRLDVRIDGIWQAEFKIKDLTRKRLENLVSKIYDYIAEDKERNKKLDRKKAISEELYQKGINLNHDRYFSVNDIEFKLGETTIFCCEQFRARWVDYTSLSETVEEFSETLNNLLNDFKVKKLEVEKAEKIALENIELIKEYYSL